GLDHDRITDARAFGFSAGDVVGRDGLVDAGDGRDTSRERDVTRLHFVAELIEHLGRRTDEDDAGFDHRTRERAFFREQSVSGMDRFGAGLLRRLDDRLRVEVALFDLRGADANAFVALERVRRAFVGVAVDRDGRDAHALARARHATRDLTPVRDQDF